MAPPAVPTERKRLRGTLRKDRIRGELVPVEGADAIQAPPPSSLKETGRAEWEHVLSTARWIAVSDLEALKIYCEILDRRQAFSDELGDSESLMLETTTGYAYINPLVVGMRQCEEQLLKWQGILGLTPSDRSKLGVAEVKKLSTLDRLAAENEHRKRQEARPVGSS